MSQITFLFDENVSKRVAKALRAIGADVLTANEAKTLGFSDRSQFGIASTLGRVFVTHDRDLLAIAKRMTPHKGLIYIYRERYTAQDTADLLADIYRTRTAEELDSKIMDFREGPQVG